MGPADPAEYKESHGALGEAEQILSHKGRGGPTKDHHRSLRSDTRATGHAHLKRRRHKGNEQEDLREKNRGRVYQGTEEHGEVPGRRDVAIVMELLHTETEATGGPFGAELEEEDEEGDVEEGSNPDEVVRGKIGAKESLQSKEEEI